jgi:hypothetical protein
MGKKVAMAPDESAYSTAAKWEITVPQVAGSSPALLKINYVGDVARIYSHGKLITDNFYNGTPWIIGLDPSVDGQPEELEVQILPLHEHSPIYLPKNASPTFPPSGLVADIQKVQVIAEHDAVMDLKP